MSVAGAIATPDLDVRGFMRGEVLELDIELEAEASRAGRFDVEICLGTR